MEPKGVWISLASAPLRVFIGRRTTFRTQHRVWLCVAMVSLTDGVAVQDCSRRQRITTIERVSASPRARVTQTSRCLCGLSRRRARPAIADFRQSPSSTRAKAILQESAAFQNVRDDADGSSGQQVLRPARHREKRHPSPWHNASGSNTDKDADGHASLFSRQQASFARGRPRRRARGCNSTPFCTTSGTCISLLATSNPAEASQIRFGAPLPGIWGWALALLAG